MMQANDSCRPNSETNVVGIWHHWYMRYAVENDTHDSTEYTPSELMLGRSASNHLGLLKVR